MIRLDWSSTGNQGKAVGKQTTNHLLSTVHDVPVGNSSGLFLTFVPQRRHDEESWLTDSFEDTEEGAADNEGREVVARGVKCQGDSPEDDVGGEVLCDRHSLDDPVGRVFDEQYSDVNTGGQP